MVNIQKIIVYACFFVYNWDRFSVCHNLCVNLNHSIVFHKMSEYLLKVK